MKIQNDLHEFQPLLVEIEDRPLNPLGRVILWLVVSVLFIGLLWLYFGEIDVVVSARGKVIPSGEIKILQPIETGVVSKILVKEGDYVLKDQVLMQIDPTVTETSLDTKMKDLMVVNLEIIRLKALTEDKPFILNKDISQNIAHEQIGLYRHQMGLLQESKMQFNLRKDQIISQLSSSKSEIVRLKSMLEKEQNTAARMEKVLDIIARKEYEETQKNIVNLLEQSFQAEQRAIETEHRLSEVKKEEKVYIQKMMSDWFIMLVEKQKEARELESQINAISFRNRQQQIKAPLNGHIGKLLVNTEGGVVAPTEKLLTIVPQDAPLIIKATVLNQDIGFVSNNMNASIKVDTFTFQKYGLIDARVFFVSNDAIEDEKLGLVYEIKLNPKKLTLTIDGKEKNLEPGMSVTVEIKVGKRRIIEFFIYPIIRYMDEGISVR